jgi:hypothetical protein
MTTAKALVVDSFAIINPCQSVHLPRLEMRGCARGLNCQSALEKHKEKEESQEWTDSTTADQLQQQLPSTHSGLQIQ